MDTINKPGILENLKQGYMIGKDEADLELMISMALGMVEDCPHLRENASLKILQFEKQLKNLDKPKGFFQKVGYHIGGFIHADPYRDPFFI